MRLRLRDVEREGTWEAAEELGPERIPLDTPDRPRVVPPARVKVSAERAGDEAVVRLEARVRVNLACARCLERFDLDLAPASEWRVPLSQEMVDVDDEVRQQVLLCLPAQPLCRTDCRGLCPRCGVNRNVSACPCAEEPRGSGFQGLNRIKLK